MKIIFHTWFKLGLEDAEKQQLWCHIVLLFNGICQFDDNELDDSRFTWRCFARLGQVLWYSLFIRNVKWYRHEIWRQILWTMLSIEHVYQAPSILEALNWYVEYYSLPFRNNKISRERLFITYIIFLSLTHNHYHNSLLNLLLLCQLECPQITSHMQSNKTWRRFYIFLSGRCHQNL